MMGERRVDACVIGPGLPGHFRVRLGQRERDVPVERLPPSLRVPNSEFVAIVQGTDLVGIEPAGREWLSVQERVRSVLNAVWDPIGVGGDVDDEYDSYIAAIYHLLKRDASLGELAAHLLEIETESKGLSDQSAEHRAETARQLKNLDLPAL